MLLRRAFLAVSVWMAVRILAAIAGAVALVPAASLLVATVAAVWWWIEGARRRDRLFMRNVGVGPAAEAVTGVLTISLLEIWANGLFHGMGIEFPGILLR